MIDYRHFFILSILLLTQNLGLSQSIPCPYVNAGPDQNADCSSSQGCSNLVATFLDIRETSSYTVETLPHNTPIAYNEPGGTPVSLNIDDVWSGVLNLPFTFCFYGQTYNQLLVGSNGNLNFNLGSASGYCPWAFTASCPSPNLVNMGNIFGVYHDIDPSVCGYINYYIVGAAPCRQFIVSYDIICQFSCTSITSRHMIVLNETTNYIDVYVESKPLCLNWNGGRAIIGLQNSAGTTGITAPGRNSNPTWTVTTPEAWRFKPSGTELYSLEWFQGATSLGSNDSITVCPANQTTYTAQFTYTQCGATTPTVLTDAVTVTPAPGQIIASFTTQQSYCGQANGSVSVNASGGTGTLTYSLDNLNFGTNATFSGLTAGNYIVYVQDQGGCTVSIPIQITEPTTLQLSEIATSNATCNLPNGSLVVNAVGGTAPYSYSINNFSTSQSSGQFDGLASMAYTVEVEDANGCSSQIIVNVTGDNAVVAMAGSSIQTSCNGASDGQLSVNTSGGPSPYQFSINNSPFGIDSVFTNLTAGTYLLTVQDADGCTDTVNMVVVEPTPLVLNTGTPVTVCIGQNVTLVANASGGTPPYLYAWNGINQNPVTYVANSTQTEQLIVTDANGCVSTGTVLTTVLPLPVAIATASPTNGGVPLNVTLINQSQNASTYSWNFGNGLNIQTTDLSTVLATYVVDGTFIIELIASNGICEDSWFDTITAVPFLPLEYSVPNVFTPNGDQVNSGYFIETKNAVSIEAIIFNRWGNKMVEINDLNYQWDGKTSNGIDASSGIYFIKYKLTGTDGTEITGHTFFHLIR